MPLRRKTFVLLRAKTSALLGRKTCAMLKAKHVLCAKPIQTETEKVTAAEGPPPLFVVAAESRRICTGSEQSTCPSQQHTTCRRSQQGGCIRSREGACPASRQGACRVISQFATALEDWRDRGSGMDSSGLAWSCLVWTGLPRCDVAW